MYNIGQSVIFKHVGKKMWGKIMQKKTIEYVIDSVNNSDLTNTKILVSYTIYYGLPMNSMWTTHYKCKVQEEDIVKLSDKDYELNCIIKTRKKHLLPSNTEYLCLHN